MTHSIKKAALSDWKIVFDILSNCAEWLSQQGMKHWQGAHTKERVMKRIRDKEVYILYENNLPVATITLSPIPPFYYGEDDKKFWKEKNAPAVHISGLAVLPNHQGRGLATELLNFAEEKAKDGNIGYIRFDAVSYYMQLNKFYLGRGYRIVGKRMTDNVASNFFEKIL